MWPSAPAIAESTAITSAIHHFTPFFSSMLFEIVKRITSLPGSRRRDPERVFSFCSSCIYNSQYWPMRTPASTKVLKKILGVKWELSGRVPGLNLLLTFPVSRICQIFGVSAASRVWRFQNQLGFRPRGRPRREMRQRCGVASTSKSRPLALHERNPLAAPPPASLSSAAASAACVASSSARGSDIRGSDIRGSNTRGGDTRGGDTRGSDVHGSDVHGSAHGIGRARKSEGRGGAVLGPAGKNARRNADPPPHGGRAAGRSNDVMRTMPSELGAAATPTARRCPLVPAEARSSPQKPAVARSCPAVA